MFKKIEASTPPIPRGTGLPALLSSELLLIIFASAIESSTFSQAKTFYYQTKLVDKRFSLLLNDPKVIAALLSKHHSLPLKLINSVPKGGIYAPLLKKTYERLLGDSFNKDSRVEEAIAFLKTLDETARRQIGYFSFSLLELPKDRGGARERFEEQLIELLALLPSLTEIRFPSNPELAPLLLKALASGAAERITHVEIQTGGAKAYLLPAINSLPALTSLLLANCDDVSTSLLDHILERHPKITSLSLLDTPHIDLRKVMFPKDFQLRKCVLRGTHFTTETTLFLLNSFPTLEHLGLGGTSTGIEGVLAVLEGDLALKELDLSLLDVRDSSFEKTSLKLRQSLQELTLYHCDAFSSKGVRTVLEMFPALLRLDVRYCDAVYLDPCSPLLRREPPIEILS